MNTLVKTRQACLTQKTMLKYIHCLICRSLRIVTDMTNFYEQYKEIKHRLVTNSSSKEENIYNHIKTVKIPLECECILCACCSTSCPWCGLNSDKYESLQFNASTLVNLGASWCKRHKYQRKIRIR